MLLGCMLGVCLPMEGVESEYPVRLESAAAVRRPCWSHGSEAVA